MLVELQCPLLLCQLRICTGIYAIKYSYRLLVVYKHKIDTMAIKHKEIHTATSTDDGALLVSGTHCIKAYKS